MLEKLLAEIKNGSTRSVDELAVRLNTTPAMIQAMLTHLEKLNLIHQYQSCGESCSGCSIKDYCNTDKSRLTGGLYVIETNSED
jgi:predicted transcriptional regulator